MVRESQCWDAWSHLSQKHLLVIVLLKELNEKLQNYYSHHLVLLFPCGQQTVQLSRLSVLTRINRGQMMVTFADSRSALSVLDMDGSKVKPSPVYFSECTPNFSKMGSLG